MDAITDTFFHIVKDKSLFCFFYDIDPIFEILDSIFSTSRCIDYYGLEDYIFENWLNEFSKWK